MILHAEPTNMNLQESTLSGVKLVKVLSKFKTARDKKNLDLFIALSFRFQKIVIRSMFR